MLTRLPLFKLLAKFPVGLLMILQIQIKECHISNAKNYFAENLLDFNRELLLK